MKPPQLDEHVTRSLDLLKDFQRATVDVVYDSLFHHGQRRMLVADEVGLGKTIVAKGVIARRIMERPDLERKKPLKVTYICSNQVIAHENVGKLDVYPDQRSHDRFASRLTFLAFEPEGGDEGVLRLNTLTPATSFNKGSSTGQQGERRILFSLLMQDEQLRSYGKPVSAMLRAGVQKAASEWFAKLKSEIDKPCGFELRPCCHERFLKAIRKKKLKYSDCPLFHHLGIFRSISLYDAVFEFSKLLTLKNLGKYRDGSDHLVRELKDILSEVCVDYIDADIYILDEFQRFKELVSRESDSEAADIARRIFGKADARILLLSATPFKAYTGDSPWESDEEHYKGFRTILGFLFDGDNDALLSYEEHRQALFKQLLELHSESGDIDTSHRDAVQQVLRRVMCRTERLSVSDDFNAMTKDKWQSQPLHVSAGDVQNFVATDNVVRYLNETDTQSKHQLHAPVEFCKSAPYPLSFLDDYKLKQQLRARKQESGVRKELRANRNAWINHRQVNQYKLEFEGNGSAAVNAKLNQVLQEVLELNGDKLLWVPPSLPCYPLAGAHKESMGFSKTLIFSAWLMVPRMLSSLISYEVERRTIGNKDSMDAQEQNDRKYFHAKNEKRHPIPQLVFSQKKSEGGETANNMSNLALLYPSHTLTDVFDPIESFANHRSLAEIRTQVATKINQLIEDAELHRFSSPSGESDRWYWAAPLLLDRRTPSLRSDVEDWLNVVLESDDSSFFKTKKGDKKEKDENSSKAKHFEELVHCFENPFDAGLGSIPADLGEILADMAIGSPAVTALRSVSKQFQPNFYDRTLFAFDIAAEFLSLFNKPESIAAVRLTTERSSYWRRVLRYCVDGCLQSVLDEFFHVLKSDCPSIWELYYRLVDSMNLGTSSIKVDGLNSFLKEKRRNLRCHYAVDLGNQRVETEDGKKRIKGIRHNFNSPFRPFVLATTSIGQEGLDFHTYCRKIVHWNLPTNPIDLEQREGRINRFKGLVIRQQIASKYGSRLNKGMVDEHGVWDALFSVADREERLGTGKCELIPFWHVEADNFQIERIIPFYPFSQDRARLSSLLKTLALYRLAFGQPRQAELVEHLLTNISEARIKEIRDKLMIDLSPIGYIKREIYTLEPIEGDNDLA
ncbi:DEAD/DEAH box helicase [Gimesia aquarii]|uniref:ATP-dependent helicase HepA n=1 Tax=Gimesia aquarii TaxID=2527964 RepID=A0A517VQH9_9PLAN|nr:helicase C-terminal domain-containing protein [Gimesia aquarii]QDT95278.1 ATP-dependent helicase HepA [Gimesia aquarii]